jgi:hypothetical protein
MPLLRQNPSETRAVAGSWAATARGQRRSDDISLTFVTKYFERAARGWRSGIVPDDSCVAVSLGRHGRRELEQPRLKRESAPNESTARSKAVIRDRRLLAGSVNCSSPMKAALGRPRSRIERQLPGAVTNSRSRPVVAGHDRPLEAGSTFGEAVCAQRATHGVNSSNQRGRDPLAKLPSAGSLGSARHRGAIGQEAVAAVKVVSAIPAVPGQASQVPAVHTPCLVRPGAAKPSRRRPVHCRARS